MVSAWVCGLRLTLGLTSVSGKPNEISAVQELINVLDLKGSVVTSEAMHCQRETAKAVVEKEADYILVAKGNQPAVENELNQVTVDAFDEDSPDRHSS